MRVFEKWQNGTITPKCHTIQQSVKARGEMSYIAALVEIKPNQVEEVPDEYRAMLDELLM